jgi:hypothetical protein
MTPGSSEFQSKQSTERECRAFSSVTPEASSGRCSGVRVCSGGEEEVGGTAREYMS